MYGSIDYSVSEKDPHEMTRIEKRGWLDDKNLRGDERLKLLSFSGAMTNESGRQLGIYGMRRYWLSHWNSNV